MTFDPDPTFITAAIGAVAAAVSAWISWRGFRHQAAEPTAPPIVNITCARSGERSVQLGIEMQNVGVVRWRAETLEIRRPKGARTATLGQLSRRFPNERPPSLDQIEGLTHVLRLNAELAPAGMGGDLTRDRHWTWAVLQLPSDEAVTLSMRLTLLSMEAKPRCKVIAIKRQLAASESTAT
ncbi:hypothetical protein V5F79_01160 [Xanthobacter flavus]|uniref:hypothetical protein n=1 Tax=Xanthobacter flavus TaxID=281 RepID=UPI003729571E